MESDKNTSTSVNVDDMVFLTSVHTIFVPAVGTTGLHAWKFLAAEKIEVSSEFG